MNPDSPLRRLTWLLVVTSLLYAFPSHADDTATAQRLFDEAKALRKAGKWEQACAKFEASLALDASVGTHLNVAKCQERKGQIASALSNYEHALAKSRSLDDDAHQQAVQKYAASKMTAIKPRVPQLRIAIEPRPHDLVIKRNGVTVPLGALGHRLYVDPGPHHVVARAQHFEPAEKTIHLNEAETQDLLLRLVARPSPPRSPNPSDATAEPPNWPWISGGIGVAAGAAALAFSIDYKLATDSLREHVDAHCGGKLDAPCITSDPSVQANGDDLNARKNRDMALGLTLGGVAVVGVGSAVIGALLHKAQDDDEQTSSRWNFGPWISQGEAGAWIRRRF